MKPVRPKQSARPPKGSIHDLHQLFESEQVHFAQRINARVQWGRWPSNPPLRRIRLGSCTAATMPVIRIHPVLDHRSVPDWFVAFVLFHEMCHIAHPPVRSGQRRSVHTKRFRQVEARHPRYAAAIAWEQHNVVALIRRAGRR